MPAVPISKHKNYPYTVHNTRYTSTTEIQTHYAISNLCILISQTRMINVADKLIEKYKYCRHSMIMKLESFYVCGLRLMCLYCSVRSFSVRVVGLSEHMCEIWDEMQNAKILKVYAEKNQT